MFAKKKKHNITIEIKDNPASGNEKAAEEDTPAARPEAGAASPLQSILEKGGNNPFHHLKNKEDAMKLVADIAECGKRKTGDIGDQFYNQGAETLLAALIFYVWHEVVPEHRNFTELFRLNQMVRASYVSEGTLISEIDNIFLDLEQSDPGHAAVKFWANFNGMSAKVRYTEIPDLLEFWLMEFKAVKEDRFLACPEAGADTESPQAEMDKADVTETADPCINIRISPESFDNLITDIKRIEILGRNIFDHFIPIRDHARYLGEPKLCEYDTADNYKRAKLLKYAKEDGGGWKLLDPAAKEFHYEHPEDGLGGYMLPARQYVKELPCAGIMRKIYLVIMVIDWYPETHYGLYICGEPFYSDTTLSVNTTCFQATNTRGVTVDQMKERAETMYEDSKDDAFIKNHRRWNHYGHYDEDARFRREMLQLWNEYYQHGSRDDALENTILLGTTRSGMGEIAPPIFEKSKDRNIVVLDPKNEPNVKNSIKERFDDR
jgi:hypothetical protein